MANYHSKEHAEFRRRLEEERAARHRQTQREIEDRKRRRLSSSIMAKWFPKGKGISISSPTDKSNSIQIRGGMFYAGVNMSDIVSPDIEEPSLINPTYEVSFDKTADNSSLPRVGKFLGYTFLSPQQRRAYLMFLASDRTDSPDIAYPFIYLYGIERRLIVDYRKRGTVSETERDELVDEVIRLITCFREKSESFNWYATMLLLYDGSIFKRNLKYETIKNLFMNPDYGNRRFTYCDNTDAYEYMLLTRLAENGYHFPERDLLNYAYIRPFRTSGAASFLGYDAKEMYESESFKYSYKLMRQRYRKSVLKESYPLSFDDTVNTGGRTIVPEYYPSSTSIRRAHITNIRSKMPDLESYVVPFKMLSDLSVACYGEVDKYLGMRNNKSLRGIEDVKLDVIFCATTPKRLYGYLHGKKIATIPQEMLEEQLKTSLGAEPQFTSKGLMSVQTQQAYSQMLASIGWQVVLPVSFEDRKIGSYIRIGRDDRIVAFYRGAWFGNKNGVQHIGNVFDANDYTPGIHAPETWDETLRLAFVMAWFMKECDADVTDDVVRSNLQLFKPVLTRKRWKRQVLALYAIIKAVRIYDITQMSPKACLSELQWDDVRNLVFSWCFSTYGRVLPSNVMSALEKLYSKVGADKQMILYDYHSVSHSSASSSIPNEFVIDDERLRDTIESTSSVQVLLSDAFAAGDDIDASVIDNHPEKQFDKSKSDVIGILSSDYDIDAVDGGKDVITNDEVIDLSGDVTGAAPSFADSPAASDSDDNKGVQRETGSHAVDSTNTPDKDCSDIIEFIKELYGDSDEMETERLKDSIKERYGLSTSADAMGVISDANAQYERENGDVLVDIDGPDAYINC